MRSRKSGTKGGAQGHSQGEVHMVAVVDGCRNAMDGTGWSNPCVGYTNGLRKRYYYFAGASFLAVKAIWALNGCLLAKNADQCKFVNEWAWLGSRSSLLTVAASAL